MLLRVLQLAHNQKDLIGLEINSDHVKLLKINSEQNPKQVEKFFITSVPEGTIIKNEIKNPDVVADLLSNAIKQTGIVSKNIALSISRSSTIVKNITVDSRLTPDELETRAWIEANHHFPDLVGESYLDFSIVGPSEKDVSQLDVILVACRKDVVDPYINVLQRVGLKPKIVDVNSFAFERALMTMGESENKTIALLNLNNDLSTLAVIHENKLIYAHDENFDAKRLQTQFLDVKDDKEKRESLLKQNLSTHLRHTMHFFYSTRPHINIEKLILAGDCAKTLDVVDFIQNETGIKTELANPFNNMSISPTINQEELKRCSPSLVLCSGLALSHLD